MSHSPKDRKIGGHGVCVKTLDGKVISQNPKCLEICGGMVGETCTKGCMSDRTSHSEAPVIDEGVLHLVGITANDHLVDAVLVNDGEYLTTYLLDKQATVDRKLEFLKLYKLSGAETVVASMLLEGRSNREIAAALFLSLSTVRTHVGHIYRKVPEEVGAVVFRKRR